MSLYLYFFVPAIIGLVAALLIDIAIHRFKRLNVFKGSYFNRTLASNPERSVQEIIDEVKLLYLHGRIQDMYLHEDYICFQDPGCSGDRNVYYIKLSELDKLYYRGVNRVYKANKRNLESVLFYLHDFSELTR
ncbi:MAG: hypothetical protein RBR69_07045 [Candidatus Cloacimonadaceae bacterium]|jgi:ABC-type siderophore export system fused ATPase/permease subunit|nr:hypothetical protein [Candidatus Cloacimonadota bacterium]MDY0127868.1 hypothetical protein [Candidatus Cloacimonadaceae bacterium]MCB5254269.1 hypothetical protein [Candidatus Cloacimonadota bacterium]MCK9178308.1 hypothetical protein [Candidatus Cloacimonadota bacterium]MCK9242542.1 hypothetical protein [Candidatus Cloacimonadota bacterium]